MIGERAEGGKVYVPSRGADPQLGVPTPEQVELPHTGTLTSFCIVNVAFYGQGMEIPYTSGLILLDGSDLPIMHLIQERSEEHTSELQSLMRISYAVFCLKKKKKHTTHTTHQQSHT